MENLKDFLLLMGLGVAIVPYFFMTFIVLHDLFFLDD